MKNLEDKIVLITGGASGIGKIMVRLMLERKAKVIIWDINEESTDKTITEFSAMGKVFGYPVDVSDLEQIQDAAKKVKQEIGIVDILINNAGIIVGKYFSDHTVTDIAKTMEI
ncbi:MAG: SDR family NAD(P)-dependent oxidoreductase, partial [Ginsengibacter sp.]